MNIDLKAFFSSLVGLYLVGVFFLSLGVLYLMGWGTTFLFLGIAFFVAALRKMAVVDFERRNSRSYY